MFEGLQGPETQTMKEFRDDDRLYLDDLQIGQRFTSGTHVVDEEQIKAFARQFDPQPFHLDNEAAKNTLLSGRKKVRRHWPGNGSAENFFPLMVQFMPPLHAGARNESAQRKNR